MKKIFVMLVAIVGFGFSVFAGQISIIKEGKVVGTLEYSYEYRSSSTGGFLEVYLYNNSDEWVSVSVQGKRVSGSCYETAKMRPYGEGDCYNKFNRRDGKIIFSCPTEPDDIDIKVYVN